MFKKIEIWILYLTILFGILFAIGFGVLVRQELVGKIKAGWVSETALILAEMPVYFKKILDGLTLEDRFTSLDGFNGTPNLEESYLLLSRYDGDMKEGVVELVNLTNFKVLHTWISKFKNLAWDDQQGKKLLYHPMLLENGNLLVDHITKINSCSKIIFQYAEEQLHHSTERDFEKNTWVPGRMYPISLSIERVGENYLDDAIVRLSPKGDVLFKKSVSEIFIDNGLEYLLFSIGDRESFDLDPIHLNDIQPVNFDGEYWKKGDIFLSLRHQSMVLLYRPSTNEIIWKGAGPFFHQHDVDILDDHRISIFNNNSKDFVNANIVDGNNEIIIYDFQTNEYSSYLPESLRKNQVRTITQGSGEILPNGDLFIEETNYGRTLYFNADGFLRWSHVNRADNNNVYHVGWSRILYTQEDIRIVNNFLENKGTCNE